MAQINKPSEYFNTKLYTGDNTATSYTGVGFQPDFIWIKDRSQTADHTLIDSVRGVKKVILSNSTAAEGTDGATQGLNSFDSDGFTLGTNSNAGSTNNTGDNYVAWNWLGGGTGVSNTDGSIASTVSANTTSGFSIVSYTGTAPTNATVGHGLGVAPKMIIFKNRNTVTDWDIYIEPVGAGKRLYLNTTSAEVVATNYMNDTAPTSTLFSVGDADNTNKSGSPQIAYCFAEKKGFSKFGSYTGNGNADGPFIYTGFKPAFVMFKVYSGNTGGWDMYDNKRVTVNPNNAFLQANASGAESTSDAVDFLSNGFKIRSTSGNQNGSGNSHIYMAFAEQPLVGTNNIPATAR
jgi:hypothetical protein